MGVDAVMNVPADFIEAQMKEMCIRDSPYLVLALCLAAGLDGIKNKIQPDAELRENVFELTEQDLSLIHI